MRRLSLSAMVFGAFLVILATALTAGRVSRGDESPAAPPAGDSIRLPSGTAVKIASFAMNPKWRDWFPADHAFFVEKFSDETLKGMHSRYAGGLDGASVVLHENGNPKVLWFYRGGQRQGPVRLWDAEKRMMLYSNYEDSKRHGITCLFRDDTPWLAQEWDKGALQNETVLVRKGSDLVAVDDAQQLTQAHETLSAVKKGLSETESDLTKSVRKWFTDEGDQAKKIKERLLTKVAHAQSMVRKQQIRQEEARRIKGIHTHRDGSLDPIGHEALQEEKSATRDLKEAKKNLEAVSGEAKRELSQMDEKTKEHYKELYHFALTALEKSLPDRDVPPPPKVGAPDVQKTFVVKFRAGNGKRHTQEILAATAEEAKEKWRERYPNAVLKSIEEK